MRQVDFLSMRLLLKSNASQREDMNSTSDFWSNDSATSPEHSPREACPLGEQNAINLQQQTSNTQDQISTETAQTEVVSCKPEPTFETCDINDVIRENQVNFRPLQTNKVVISFSRSIIRRRCRSPAQNFLPKNPNSLLFSFKTLTNVHVRTSSIVAFINFFR